MTPQELSDIDRQVAEAIGESYEKHDWECVGTGYYESAYVCKICGENYFGDALEFEEPNLPKCAHKFSTSWDSSMYAAEKAGLFFTDDMCPPHALFMLTGKWEIASITPAHEIGKCLPCRSESGPLAICKAILSLKGGK